MHWLTQVIHLWKIIILPRLTFAIIGERKKKIALNDLNNKVKNNIDFREKKTVSKLKKGKKT